MHSEEVGRQGAWLIDLSINHDRKSTKLDIALFCNRSTSPFKEINENIFFKSDVGFWFMRYRLV